MSTDSLDKVINGSRRDDDGFDDSRQREALGEWSRRFISPSVRVALASTMAALGGLMFGYDTGVISGALLQLRVDFGLTCFQSEVVVSVLLAGALLASLCGGFLVDFCGRKETIVVNDVMFLVGTVVLATANTYASLVVGRFIVGFAVCLSATAECVYISEISPPKKRGFLVSLNEFGITIGFLLAYIIGYAFISVDNGWRYMFGFGAVLAVVQAIGMFFLPPSPRYHILKGKEQQARVTLHTILEPKEAEEEFCRMKQSVEEELKRPWREAFHGVDGIGRRFLMVMILMLLQQLTGQATVLYYAPILFQEVGFVSNTSAALATVGLGTVKVVVTIVYLMLTNKVGRRTMLLSGAALMLVSTAAFGVCAKVFFHQQPITASCRNTSSTASNSSLGDDLGILSSLTPSSSNYSNAVPGFGLVSPVGSWLSLLCILVYVTGYSIGFGPGTWLITSEMFPAYIKGRAISVATSFNWASNFLVSITFLNVISNIGAAVAFWLYSAMCLLSLVFIGLYIPETKDRSLEDITLDMNRQQHQLGRSCCREHDQKSEDTQLVIQPSSESAPS